MPPGIATVVYAVGVFGLSALDRDVTARASKPLGIPVVSVSFAGSRMVSQWLDGGSQIASPDPYLDGTSLDRNIRAGLVAVGVNPDSIIQAIRAPWPKPPSRILKANSSGGGTAGDRISTTTLRHGIRGMR